MLNTSLHNPNVKDKPSVQKFTAMNRGINDGGDLPEDLLRVSEVQEVYSALCDILTMCSGPVNSDRTAHLMVHLWGNMNALWSFWWTFKQLGKHRLSNDCSCDCYDYSRETLYDNRYTAAVVCDLVVLQAKRHIEVTFLISVTLAPYVQPQMEPTV